jgi:hypothetical protein
MKNIDKWNNFLKVLDDRLTEFLKEQNITIPQTFYKVNGRGNIDTCDLELIKYHWKLPYTSSTNKITKIMLERIEDVVKQNTNLTVGNVYITYKASKALVNYTASVFYNEFIDKTIVLRNVYFDNLEEAELKSKEFKDIILKRELFYETHKKDLSYNYEANGYKFLGWQNGWEYIRIGEEQGLTPNPVKYPEYSKCREQEHQLIEVRRGDRGYENIVSCPLCKIYWKYDCSD